MANTAGCMTASGIYHRLFKSTPAKFDQKFPNITPSGFIRGMILKMHLDHR